MCIRDRYFFDFLISADSLVTFAGERWDFIINANNRIGNYWIKLRGLADCGPAFNKAYTLAVLHYENASDDSPASTVTYDTIQVKGIVSMLRDVAFMKKC